MSKERLDEIRERVKEIMETPYVARREKAVEVGIDFVMTGKIDFLLQEIDLANEQNKYYRDGLLKVMLDQYEYMEGYETVSFGIAKEALGMTEDEVKKLLEGEE